jgi:hypothetical protein
MMLGGLRIVTPPNSDKYAQESSRQFDEAYGESLGLTDMHAEERRGEERECSHNHLSLPLPLFKERFNINIQNHLYYRRSFLRPAIEEQGTATR